MEKLIHRYYEPFSPTVGFLHDICYEVDANKKVSVKSLQTHTVENGILDGKIISHDDPLNELSIIASYSILAKDCVMDMNTNFLIE